MVARPKKKMPHYIEPWLSRRAKGILFVKKDPVSDLAQLELMCVRFLPGTLKTFSEVPLPVAQATIASFHVILFQPR